MLSADCEPLLTDVELDDLLAVAKRPDQYGVTPTLDSWVPTWELNAAAAEGWRTKAGKAASATSFSMDGATYQRGDLLAHCEAMVRQYEGRIVTRDGGPVEADWDIVGNL
jgi:hypothetical protein